MSVLVTFLLDSVSIGNSKGVKFSAVSISFYLWMPTYLCELFNVKPLTDKRKQLDIPIKQLILNKMDNVKSKSSNGEYCIQEEIINDISSNFENRFNFNDPPPLSEKWR